MKTFRTGVMNKHSSLTTRRFRNHNNRVNLSPESEMELESKLNRDYIPSSATLTELTAETKLPSPYHYHRLVSCNDENRNVLYQVSPAQRERMKTYMSSRSTKQTQNYELVKKLESIAATHNTSVPVVLKSWNKNKRARSWSYLDAEIEDQDEEFDQGFSTLPDFDHVQYRIQLTSDEITSLNSVSDQA